VQSNNKIDKMNYIPRKNEFDELADKIRRNIERLGACSLQNQELSVIWRHEEGKSNAENHMHLANFSVQYGFIHRADENFKTVSFRMLN